MLLLFMSSIQVLDGAMACPPEDGVGLGFGSSNHNYQRFLTEVLAEKRRVSKRKYRALCAEVSRAENYNGFYNRWVG